MTSLRSRCRRARPGRCATSLRRRRSPVGLRLALDGSGWPATEVGCANATATDSVVPVRSSCRRPSCDGTRDDRPRPPPWAPIRRSSPVPSDGAYPPSWQPLAHSGPARLFSAGGRVLLGFRRQPWSSVRSGEDRRGTHIAQAVEVGRTAGTAADLAAGGSRNQKPADTSRDGHARSIHAPTAMAARMSSTMGWWSSLCVPAAHRRRPPAARRCPRVGLSLA